MGKRRNEKAMKEIIKPFEEEVEGAKREISLFKETYPINLLFQSERLGKQKKYRLPHFLSPSLKKKFRSLCKEWSLLGGRTLFGMDEEKGRLGFLFLPLSFGMRKKECSYEEIVAFNCREYKVNEEGGLVVVPGFGSTSSLGLALGFGASESEEFFAGAEIALTLDDPHDPLISLKALKAEEFDTLRAYLEIIEDRKKKRESRAEGKAQ